MVARQNLWPEFNGAPAISFPRGNGTEHIFFGEDAKNITLEQVIGGKCLDLTRISHHILHGQEVISGLYVRPEERGSGLGGELIDYFIENASKASAEFGGTSLIHKPGLAVLLGKRCLYPEHYDFEVAIPGRYKDDTASDIPNVIILRDDVDPSRRQHRVRRTNENGRREFYHVVGGPGWGEQPNRGMPRTYLHTRFTQL